jgi:hypothetical protein
MEPAPLKPIIPTKKHDDHAGYLHRQVIGYLGMLLPIALWAIARNRPMTGLTNGDLLTSMSAYYYTGATAVFTGVLAALAVYLFTYTGYGNGAALWDRGMAWVAGAAAVGVALYPTGAPAKALELLWWTEPTGTVHGVAATILFVDFAFMSFFLFTKTDKNAPPPDTDKKVRNAIYRFCGIAMFVCIAWAGNNQFLSQPKKPIFLPEALTLVLFAFSWLTKGRAEKTAGRLLHRAWHYARNREQLKADVAGAIREMKSPPKPPGSLESTSPPP